MNVKSSGDRSDIVFVRCTVIKIITERMGYNILIHNFESFVESKIAKMANIFNLFIKNSLMTLNYVEFQTNCQSKI